MKKKIILAISLLISVPTIAVAFSFLLVGIYIRNNLNTEYDETLFNRAINSGSTIFYANCSTEGDEYIPVKIDVSGDSKKIYYELDEISDYLIDGFIAVEDRRFYKHSGVDIKRTLYAAANYITRNKKSFGASTITQQVVKNISGDNELSVKRKLSEIVRAYNIEKKHTKSEIMEVYLNIVPMSDQIVGVGAASELYFGKPPSELTVEEAAAIIGITNAPSLYNPYKNPDSCLKKRNTVINIMYKEGVINQEEYHSALNAPLALKEKENKIDSWFIETVMSDIVSDYAAEMKISDSLARLLISSGGYSVYTTVDLRIQEILESHFENEANFSPKIKDGLNYSVIVSDPKNGNILGIIGKVGEKRGNRLLNNATVPHVPASTLKPIALYAPLIDDGEISWSSVFDDIPVSFRQTEDDYHEFPKNSPNIYAGLITVKDAIRKSKNTVAVRLCQMRGIENVFKTLKEDYSFDTVVEKIKTDDGRILTDKGISPLALGQLTYGVPLRKMTEAYSVFPNLGIKNKSRSYLLMTDKNGNKVLENSESGVRILKDGTAKIMNQLLSEVVSDGTAKSISLKNKLAVAGKTGTSGGGYDKMFIGYTPFLCCGIWCGSDGEKINLSGVYPSHLQIWDDVMTRICNEVYPDNSETFDTEGLVYAPYCMDSGDLFSSNCIYDPRGSRMEYGYFTSDTLPSVSCKTHVIVNYDTSRKGVVLNNENSEYYAKVSLVKNEKRSFPKEIFITDAEYVYRDINLYSENKVKVDLPYFYGQLNEGEFAGISNKKKQFNSFAENID